MKRCPACGQDNPDAFTHCEWCGHSLKTAKSVDQLDKPKKSSAPRASRRSRAFDTQNKSAGPASRIFFGFGVLLLIACIIFLAVVFRFNFICVIPACVLIVFAYLLNLFSKLFLGKNSEPTRGKKALLSAVSLVFAAAAIAFVYLSVVTA